MTTDLVPAAQYVRMSKEDQRYSIQNQVAVIQGYADKNGFLIVKTYADGGKSGVVLKRRSGLRQLLQDVMSKCREYRAILVCDVSRWGRFQDADEAAHYEFICKSAGVPVHYCAEIFPNDCTPYAMLMKALKRTGAAEFSRELGAKIAQAQRRLAGLGFKQGGMAGFGLRRMLISSEGTPKQQLAFGERKCLAYDRVILVLGPPDEVECVRNIYRMLTVEKYTVSSIARKLNTAGIKSSVGTDWKYESVKKILTDPKYAGYCVFGRTTSRLYTTVKHSPKSEWVLTPRAFEAIIDEVTFEKAQRILNSRTITKSNGELLDLLRKLLAKEGNLTHRIIKSSSEVPSPSTYRGRFGSLGKAYELIDYGVSNQFLDVRCRTRALRDELVSKIAGMYPQDLTVVRRGAKWRPLLRMRDGLIVSVLVGRTMYKYKQQTHWRIVPNSHERKYMTLLARLNNENNAIFDYHVLPDMKQGRTFDMALNDERLSRGQALTDLSDFTKAVKQVQKIRLGMRRSACM